jgi:uncharacterized RDD family membrane protein YckC
MNGSLSEAEVFDVKAASPAGILRRAAAYLVDIAILAAAVVITQLGIQAITGGFPANQLNTGLQIEAWVFATVSLPVWAYFTLLEGSVWQASLGKRLLGLQVTDTMGNRIGYGRALLRTIVKLLPWELTHLSLMLPTPIWDESASANLRPGLIVAYALLVLYIVVAVLTPRKQSVHDLIARTLVVLRRTMASRTEPT